MNFRGSVVSICIALALSLLSVQAVALPILANGVVYIEASPDPLYTTPVPDPDPLVSPIGSIAYNGGYILLEDFAYQPLTTYDPNHNLVKKTNV